jgi:hypothetical protein
VDDNQEVFISVRPQRATLTLSREAVSQNVQCSINLMVTLSDGDIRTPEGQSLRDAEWSVYLSRAETYNETATAAGAMGFLIHHEELSDFDMYTPESCHIAAAVKPEMFDLLLTTLQAGHLPDNIMLRVKGLSYGKEFDGSIVEWDTSKNKSAPVIYISIGLPLTALPNIPVMSADIKSVESPLNEAVKILQQKLLAKLQWVISLLAILAIMVAILR